MCGTCGCSDNEQGYTIEKPGANSHGHAHGLAANHQHDHTHSHDHSHHHHGHGHNHNGPETLKIASPVLGKNNLMAERNRGYFEAKQIKTFNLVSSPGSGKTTILESLIKHAKDQNIYVIEGDQQTLNDAERIDNAGAQAIQINTGNGCHLDAEMVNRAVKELNPANESILFIENVGNLVCPALFDLGESSRIVIASITEGADKPLKYPTMFETSHLCVINKMDLLPYVDFDLEKFKEYALKINHRLSFIELSATQQTGIKELIDWINR